jgi:hypothetical protein
VILLTCVGDVVLSIVTRHKSYNNPRRRVPKGSKEPVKFWFKEMSTY